MNQSKVDHQNKVPVLCIHGDTVLYPTATVEFQIGKWRQSATVVVAPKLPVAVLLGRDIGEPDGKNPAKGLAVVTRSQKQHTQEGDKDDKEQRGKESEQEATADLPKGEETKEETVEDSDPELRATPKELREWQQKDKSL